MQRRRAQPAFTLLELVLVMVIICIALAMAAPSLRGWGRGAQLRDAADQFVAMTRYARSQAVANSSTYRLVIDSQAGSYKLTQQNGQDFVDVQSSWGRTINMPDGVHMQMTRTSANPAAAVAADAGPQDQSYLEFFPTGRTDQAQVLLTSEYGGQILIECPSPAEGFVIAQSPAGGSS